MSICKVFALSCTSCTGYDIYKRVKTNKLLFGKALIELILIQELWTLVTSGGLKQVARRWAGRRKAINCARVLVRGVIKIWIGGWWQHTHIKFAGPTTKTKQSLGARVAFIMISWVSKSPPVTIRNNRAGFAAGSFGHCFTKSFSSFSHFVSLLTRDPY